jgi:hypothetical protein
MKWFDQWFYRQAKKAWENKDTYEEDVYTNKVTAKAQRGLQLSSGMAIEKGRVEGEDRISFELTSAVGGRILNVRRYDPRNDRNDSQTYVIPSGEDVGTRVAKIINLELLK